MKSVVSFKHRFTHALPEHLKNQDIRLSEDLLEYFIQEFTKKGDYVFDPFAGFGTTLVSAERLGRNGFGVEQNPEWHAYATSLLESPQGLLLCDIRDTDLTLFPAFEFCISSPVYMHQDEVLDPLSGFKGHGTYDGYINDLASIYKRVADRLTDDGLLVVEACNLKGPGGVTTFAWDLCDALKETLVFKGETVANWDHYGYGDDHSYCVLFGK